MDTAWTWELSGYCAKYSFLTEPKGLTMREVERIFQLTPEPPIWGNLNDYILEAVQRHNLRWFSFFLHCYENRLNGRVRRFLLREGLDRYDPERFLDYKMGCVLVDEPVQFRPLETAIRNWCCTIKVDIGNSKGQYIEKDKQEATKDGSESAKIQHGI